MAGKKSGFDFKNIHFETNRVENMSNRDLNETRHVWSEAMGDSLPAARGSSFLRHLEGVEAKRAHLQSHRDPSEAFANQGFRDIRLTRAFARDERTGRESLAGHLYTAQNTSGGLVMRNLKLYAPAAAPLVGGKRYVHGRELAVLPEYQHRGLGHGLAYVALAHGKYKPDQTVSAYIWPTELPKMADSLEAIGLHNAGRTEAQPIYGDGYPSVEQERWIGQVGVIKQAILGLPGFADAIRNANVPPTATDI